MKFQEFSRERSNLKIFSRSYANPVLYAAIVLRTFVKKRYTCKYKITPDDPKTERGLAQLISICQEWIKVLVTFSFFFFFPFFIQFCVPFKIISAHMRRAYQ